VLHGTRYTDQNAGAGEGAPNSLFLHTSGVVCLSMASKAERWAARAREAHAGPAPAPSKAARWSAESAAQAPAGVHSPASPQANQTPTFMHLVRQDRLEWPTPCQPAPGSAMEAWMSRAEAKQLHLPWPEKIRDYADEVHLSVKVRLAAFSRLRNRRFAVQRWWTTTVVHHHVVHDYWLIACGKAGWTGARRDCVPSTPLESTRNPAYIFEHPTEGGTAVDSRSGLGAQLPGISFLDSVPHLSANSNLHTWPLGFPC